MNEEYTCEMCYNTYEKGWSDIEADKEAEELWRMKDATNNLQGSIICDDCFQKIHPSKFPELAEKARNELKS